MALPPPRCDCTHEYAQHTGGGACRVILRHNHDENTQGHEKCDPCPCAKFSVPRGRGRAAHRAPKSKPKGTPWWR